MPAFPRVSLLRVLNVRVCARTRSVVASLANLTSRTRVAQPFSTCRSGGAPGGGGEGGASASDLASTVGRDRAPRMRVQKCDPYGQGGLPLPNKEVDSMMASLDADWRHDADKALLVRTFQLSPKGSFTATGERGFAFAALIGRVALNTGHAPAAVAVATGPETVEVRLHTTPLRGLSHNDFLLAFKLDNIYLADFAQGAELV